ncbi:MAG TPA: hypothetical protein VJR89_27190 [Polyangiales bacterium]|nr:hypothetical protein [Polyangiales bacterium]
MIAVAWLKMSDIELGGTRVLGSGFAFGWPVVPTLAALIAQRPRHVVAIALGYLACGSLLVGGWSMIAQSMLGRADVSVMDNVIGSLKLLAVTAPLPAAIIAVTGTRKLRPVLPLLLSGLLVFCFASLGLFSVFVSAVDIPALGAWLLRLGMTPTLMLASLPVGYVCWWAQRWLGRQFARKHFSDVQLVVDAWWFVAMFSLCVGVATDVGWHALWMLIAFLAYRALVGIGLRLWPVSSAEPVPSRLLLLRVFRTPRHAERLFDVVAQRWRYRGSVNMIAGADLAARTIDPGDILSFLSGELHSAFVKNDADLAERIRSLDLTRDPDGRFRVNELYCFDDTWQRTLEALVDESDVILMDLRGFSHQNQGCIYELRKLAERGKLMHTLFVLDHASDEALLRAALDTAGAQHEAAVPLQVIRVKRQSARELRRVIDALENVAQREPAANQLEADIASAQGLLT